MAMQQELDHHHQHHEDDHEDDHPLHIAVFPWLAFGHMMPLLELSKTLANKGHHVSYLATPRNISRLSSTTLPSLLTFIPLPLPQTPGLPDFAEATSEVSPDQVQYLKLALDSLQHHPFTTFLQEASPKPDWILLDFSTPWAIPIASKFSIPCVFFSVFTASFLTFIGPPSEITEGKGSRRLWENFTESRPAWIPFPSKLAYSLHGARNLMALTRAMLTVSRCLPALYDRQGRKALAPRTQGKWNCGLPLMLLPIYVDQEANARMVGERGFGVEVERRGEDGFFSREEVARVLRLVMLGEEGERVRVRAREMKKVFADREGQEKYVDEFVRFMKVHKKL
ncbi:hypothetical protein J5N97_011023 [Dioscorea zingiberensis]|uniref:Uncharacterized protein n=1 Tax=Dioscorea zingiberensis TaxID=325984 RepID=A0A9D5D0I4_9LILI|nr:hypothetical protein J5N97_011023 [Dioscorea zingiberensis]